ncbi:MAG: hypothetical protein J6P17_05980 [Acidaminococcaceae bacterium]|nr:hypothetical protein [Acidaminococcaceae bacterium]
MLSKLPDEFLPQNVKRGIKILAVVCLAGIILFIALAHLASGAAARIFNREMEKQTMLRGTITVESIMGHINGDVSFENLVWREPDGDLVLQVPEGSFHVRPWDIVTRNVKSTTIQQLTLKNAVISLRFNENMQVDFLDQKQGKLSLPKTETKQKTEQDTEQNTGWDLFDDDYDFDDDGSNFNLEGRRLRSEIVLEDCRLEARYRKRHYVLNNVNMKMGLHTSGQSHIDLSTGKFGGTMQGGGLSLFGDINFKPATPELDIDISLRDVDPSSLGFGMNVHDFMTVVARLEGPVTGPKGRGTVKMKELHIPALHFTDVIGDVNYAGGLFRFTDVNAKVFGGDLRARGDYHIDTRVYHIYGVGSKLKSMQALNDLRFSCLVDLNLMLQCNGNPRNILAYGDFKSGKGHYSIFPFNSLEGRFTNRFRELHIYDAVIDSPFGRVSTDAFSIINNKLRLGKIVLTDQDTGENITIREEDKEKPRKQKDKS